MIHSFDRYELDEDNLSLSRDGQRLPLEPRALAVLVQLVRGGGRLLRKEQLLEAVWKNTIVEESSLSRAVALLLKQLHDDPRNPLFIETVPTLGYRFIAEVRSGRAVQADDPLPGAAEGVSVAPDAATANPARRRLWTRRPVWVLLAALTLFVAVAGVRFMQHRRPQYLDRKSIVLADFENATGEPVFDGTLRQGLTVQLDQSPLLTLVSDRRIQTVLTQMGQRADARLTPALGREVCQRTGAAGVLEGSIASLGSHYVVGLRATACGSGAVLDTEQIEASRKEDVLRALDQIASRFRVRVGESLGSLSNRDIPLEEATTSSLDALKAFSEATRVQNVRGSAAAEVLLQRAIVLDPQFAMAHALLSRMYGDLGEEMKSAQSAAEAYRFRSRASERERYFIAASYETQVTGNLEQAEETCEAWARAYPDDPGSLGFPAGLILRVFGRYEEAAAKAAELVSADRGFAIAYHLLVVNDIALGRVADGISVLDDAATRHLKLPQYLLDRHRLAFLKGDRSAMDRVTAAAASQPASEQFIAGEVASTLAYAGRLRDSLDVAHRAMAQALQLNRRELAARMGAGAAIKAAWSGDMAAAVSDATGAMDLSNGRDAEYGAAVALALAQRSPAAQGLADDLEKRLPEDTAARFHYLPVIRALLALNRNDPGAALEALKANMPYELGTPPSNYSGFYGALYPVFVRGLAYLAAHRPAEAAAEFRKILDHPELTVSDPIGALARLELGRALMQAGDITGAKAAYARFLDSWKAADAGLPVYRAAQAEYTRF